MEEGGGGAFEAPPQAQELQKSPGGIGLYYSQFANDYTSYAS